MLKIQTFYHFFYKKVSIKLQNSLTLQIENVQNALKCRIIDNSHHNIYYIYRLVTTYKREQQKRKSNVINKQIIHN